MGRGRRDCDVIFCVCLHAKKRWETQTSKQAEGGRRRGRRRRPFNHAAVTQAEAEEEREGGVFDIPRLPLFSCSYESVGELGRPR